MKYSVRCRENGDVIEYARTMEEAEAIIAKFEAEDTEDGTFSPDFYEVHEQEVSEEVVTNIKTQLANKGMTQKDLAEKLGINPVSLNAMLRGGNLTLATLDKFATAIGCEVADFFAQPRHVCPHCGHEIAITIQ